MKLSRNEGTGVTGLHNNPNKLMRTKKKHFFKIYKKIVSFKNTKLNLKNNDINLKISFYSY